MKFENLKFEQLEGVAKVTLNRPESLNSLNEPLLRELLVVADECSSNSDIRAVLITGAGRAFCAGADLSSIDLDNSPEARRATGEGVKEMMLQLFNPVVSKFSQMSKPVITAINGIAAGGGVGLALCGDIVLASSSTAFKQVFIPQLGIIPDLGSTWFVPRLAGRAKAMGMAMLGETISAQQADDWGMVWKVVADDQLQAEAQTIATKLASGPTFGLAKLKQAIRISEKHSLDEQLSFEADTQLECCASEDFIEGCAAFMEKRKPQFKGC